MEEISSSDNKDALCQQGREQKTAIASGANGPSSSSIGVGFAEHQVDLGFQEGQNPLQSAIAGDHVPYEHHRILQQKHQQTPSLASEKTFRGGSAYDQYLHRQSHRQQQPSKGTCGTALAAEEAGGAMYVEDDSCSRASLSTGGSSARGGNGSPHPRMSSSSAINSGEPAAAAAVLSRAEKNRIEREKRRNESESEREDRLQKRRELHQRKLIGCSAEEIQLQRERRNALERAKRRAETPEDRAARLTKRKEYETRRKLEKDHGKQQRGRRTGTLNNFPATNQQEESPRRVPGASVETSVADSKTVTPDDWIGSNSRVVSAGITLASGSVDATRYQRRRRNQPRLVRPLQKHIPAPPLQDKDGDDPSAPPLTSGSEGPVHSLPFSRSRSRSRSSRQPAVPAVMSPLVGGRRNDNNYKRARSRARRRTESSPTSLHPEPSEAAAKWDASSSSAPTSFPSLPFLGDSKNATIIAGGVAQRIVKTGVSIEGSRGAGGERPVGRIHCPDDDYKQPPPPFLFPQGFFFSRRSLPSAGAIPHGVGGDEREPIGTANPDTSALFLAASVDHDNADGADDEPYCGQVVAV